MDSLIKKKRGARATKKQFEMLVDFMEHNKIILSTLKKDESIVEAKWEEICNILNVTGYGPEKSVKQWKRAFIELRCNAKKRYKDLHSGEKSRELIPYEEQLLELLSQTDTRNIEDTSYMSGYSMENSYDQDYIKIEDDTDTSDGEPEIEITYEDNNRVNERNNLIVEEFPTLHPLKRPRVSYPSLIQKSPVNIHPTILPKVEVREVPNTVAEKINSLEKTVGKYEQLVAAQIASTKKIVDSNTALTNAITRLAGSVQSLTNAMTLRNNNNGTIYQLITK